MKRLILLGFLLAPIPGAAQTASDMTAQQTQKTLDTINRMQTIFGPQLYLAALAEKCGLRSNPWVRNLYGNIGDYVGAQILAAFPTPDDAPGPTQLKANFGLELDQMFQAPENEAEDAPQGGCTVFADPVVLNGLDRTESSTWWR